MSAYRPKSPEEIARNMSAIRSTGNKTETALRKAIHAMGLRYRKYAHNLPGRPDIVFPTEKVAVFVDGDYWHGRLVRERGLDYFKENLKTANKEYWLRKMERNITRDDSVTAALEQLGWQVVRLWESDVKRDLDATTAYIANLVRERRV